MKLTQIMQLTVNKRFSIISTILVGFCFVFSTLNAQNNDKISAQYNEAIKLISEKEYQQAKEKLDWVISERKDYAEAIFARGTCHLMLQERESACIDFESAKAYKWAPASEYIEKFCGKDAYGRTLEKQKHQSE
jgi:Tfp pilus assembly protein PilF